MEVPLPLKLSELNPNLKDMKVIC